MKKKQFWGLPGLCLCLIVTSLLLSCAVRRQGKVPSVQSDLEVKVWLRVGEYGWHIPVDDSLLVIPFAVKEINNIGPLPVMVVSYRLNNIIQLSVLKERLLATGTVESLIITSINRKNPK